MLLPPDGVARRPALGAGALAPDHAHLRAEHGLSLLVEVERGGAQQSLLYDAGLGRDTALHNMDVLGVGLGDLRAVVLSHGHSDHHGGLEGMVRRAGRAGLPLVLHPRRPGASGGWSSPAGASCTCRPRAAATWTEALRRDRRGAQREPADRRRRAGDRRGPSGSRRSSAACPVVRRRSRLSGDTAIGLLFVGMLALGVVIVSRSDSFSGDLTSILFGEVLGISWGDVWLQLGAAVAVAAVCAVCARPFLLLAFDREHARAAGFSPDLYEWLLLGMVALTVVVSFQTVGTLLVFGMLIAPPATAALAVRRIGAMMAVAAVLGVLSVAVGLLLSYHYDLAAGASIVLVEVAAFFVVLTAQSLRRPAVRPAPA